MPEPAVAAAAACCLFDTAVGRLGIAWTDDDRVQAVQLPEAEDEGTLRRMRKRCGDAPLVQPPVPVQQVIGRLQAHLEGGRDALLDVPLDDADLPDFQRRVYAAARAIPPGQVTTYGEMARGLGDPGAARAVGQALSHNPFAPLVPCHRILAAKGGSGGFSAEGGTLAKLRLLEIERAQLGEGGAGLFD